MASLSDLGLEISAAAKAGPDRDRQLGQELDTRGSAAAPPWGCWCVWGIHQGKNRMPAVDGADFLLKENTF